MEEDQLINHEVIKASYKDYLQLVKVGLTNSVLITAALGYILGILRFPETTFSVVELLAVVIGGFLVTGASNGINQIIEIDFDAKMSRTSNRPLVNNRISVINAAIFCAIAGFAGILILGLALNATCAWLGLFALVIYTMAYTPLKRHTSISVFVGAIPGAIPPVIGWVAVSGTLDPIAYLLFCIQFFWQFPHFWAIAWILHDDYEKAGYFLLPSSGGRNKNSALQTVWYTVILLVVSMLPWFYFPDVFGNIVTPFVVLIYGGYFAYRALRLFQTLEIKEAKKLMFASFFYMPLLLSSYLFNPYYG
ncbi:MAG: protoheme IX farnesyltransferase [Bacteroidia bacterium]|nr:protoheme IX farnesyltransferase [Bacteroidia bacterium]